MKLSVLFLSVLLVFGLVICGSSYAEEDVEAYSRVRKADDALKKAYVAVSDAERAGANVSSLIVRLNEAGGVLAVAEMAYGNKDYDGASEKAEACVMMANGVFADASRLKSSALVDARLRFLNTLMLSITSAVVFVAGLVLVWIWFKRSYLRRLLKMKPEVASDVRA